MFQDIQPPKKSVSKFAGRKSLTSLGGQAISSARQRLGQPDGQVDSGASASTAEVASGGHLRRWWRHLTENKRFALVSAALLVFAIGAISYFYFTRPSSETSIAITKHPQKTVAPTTVASPLTGVQIDPELAKRPVTGIMIENSPDARPQSGIQDAGIVFEAIAEGGITRFMTLYQDAQPQYIGPVRSLRPYFLDFATPFQAGIVHVGGSPEALATVRNGHYRDLDQFFNSSYFSRIPSRAAPHNVYTSFERLDALNKAKGYTSSTFTSWPRKADKKLATPTAKAIDFKISSALYYAHYDYDAGTNSYYRVEGGARHYAITSAADPGAQLHPKVVMALVMSYNISSDGQHSVYSDTGSGTAYIFQDGGVTKGTWHKADQATNFTFGDANGNYVKLDAGQTWVTIVRGENEVSYTP